MAGKTRHAVWVSVVGGVCLAASHLCAQPSPAGDIRPTAHAVRIAPNEAPLIDGDVSDPIWAKAQVLDDFRTTDPVPGLIPSERTEIRILYDENALYFSIYNYDDEPDKIVVRTLARDGILPTGDHVRIFLDPDMTRRNAYEFDIGPTSARYEALVQNNVEVLPKWNALWSAKARRVADGWTAEVAIPFQSLSYEPSHTEWGFDFFRLVRRKTERIRFATQDQKILLTDMSRIGVLTGISNTRQGAGLDLQFYGNLRYKEDWQTHPHRGALSGALSANAYYKIAQALTGTLTINPDFSDSPLDERQVNTTRFSLFTPETRDFFLQDATAFEFGGRGFLKADNARPFFSRNIGLVKGLPVTILGGVKMSGQYDDIGIGALSVRTNRTRTTAAQTLSAVRITEPVFAESKVGLMLTNGDPTGLSKNTVAGADFQYRDSNLPGGNVLQSDIYYERSFSDTAGDDDSIGVAFNFPNEPWAGELRFKQIGENFFPALGFVNRPGIRQYNATMTKTTRFRDAFLRYWTFNTNTSFITGLDNRFQGSTTDVWAGFYTHVPDLVELHFLDYSERVPTTFALPRDVPVLAGSYHWTNIKPYFNTAQSRVVVFEWSIECCSFYNGHYVNSDLVLSERPNEMLEFSQHWVATFIDLPTGYVAIHILSFNTMVNFTPDMQFLVQAQFDNISRSFGVSVRYRWEYEPGNELFVALGQAATIPGTTFVPQSSQMSVRLGHMLRF